MPVKKNSTFIKRLDQEMKNKPVFIINGEEIPNQDYESEGQTWANGSTEPVARVWCYVSVAPDINGVCEMTVIDNDYQIAVFCIDTNSDVFKALVSMDPSVESPFQFTKSSDGHMLH